MHPEDIKAALRKQGVTQAKLAEQLNVDESTVSQIIHSRRSRRIEKAIARVLKSKPEVLWPDRYHQHGKRRAA